jgi:hypothetical protein
MEYDSQYMNNLVRLLTYFIEQQDNPGNMRGSSLTIAQSSTVYGSTVPATNIIAKQGYVIASVGTTNFVAFGASSNTVGIHFVATATGSGASGTGTATIAQFSSGVLVPVSASLIEIGKQYTIVTVGTTNFTAIGASSNTIGIRFTATGGTSGTGTVLESSEPGVVWCDPTANNVLKILP